MNKFRLMSVVVILAMLFSFANVSPALAASPISEAEPNDSLGTAQNVDSGPWTLDYDANIGNTSSNTSTTMPHISIYGTGNYTFDYYSFTVDAAGTQAIFDIDYGMPDFDPYLTLFNSAGTQLTASDDASTSYGQGGSVHPYDSYIEYTFSTAGTYAIRVGRCCVSEVPSGADYTLQISLSEAPNFISPRVTNDAYSVDEDQVLTVAAPGVLTNDSDPQNDPITASLVDGTTNGMLILNGDGSFTYTPDADFHGTDSFTYFASDGANNSRLAKVTITVNSVNDLPVVDLNGADEAGIDFSTSFRVGDPPVLVGDFDLTLADADVGVMDVVSGSGLIYVVYINGTIISIDPMTGTQTQVNTNYLICSARMMTIDSATQELFVADACGRVVQVDIATGVETILASGSYLNNGAWGIDLDPNGDIVVASYSYVIRIDRSTGAQTLVTTISSGCSYGLAVEADGDILVTDPCYNRIVKIDPVSGAQTVLTNNIYSAYDITVDAVGDLFVVEIGRSGQITQVDPNSGASTMIAAGSSLTNQCAYSIDVDKAGNLITTDYCSGIVAKTEIDSGAQVNLANVPQYGPIGVAVDAGSGLQTIEWATLQITNLMDGANEVLAADTTGTNISVAYDSGTGTLSLTGDDTAEKYQAVLRTVTYSNANPSGGSRIIEVIVNDGTDSNSPTALSTITLNSPPTADAGGSYSGNEGSAIALSSASASDPDVGDTLTYSWNVDSALCSFNDASLLNPDLTCSDNGSFTATLEVSDGSETDSSEASVTVNNVAPTLGAISVDLALIPVNTAFNASADFTDPGVLDTHTAAWDWGDGTSAGTVTQGAGSGSVNDSHSYSVPGVYTVKLIVTDNDLGDSNESAYQFVVVYDPNGGFVTGGGWIDSPVNEEYQYMQVGGRASFGFVAKYKKGANVPDGNTQFQFRAGDLNFHSSSYEWLVVAGNQAMFKGEGTINGQGSYKFMITADDDNPDTFRIQIWYEDGGEVVVYDNGSQQSLGGGSIVIHK